jgi:RimJ/RimL family protein N-acetyltransferase
MSGFTIRPMTTADKPAVLDIASRIWEGSDYLPSVFDDWIADRDGEFVAVLLDRRVVGCGKLTFLTPVDAWLEGLRKDPLVSEGGLAEAVTRYFLRRLSTRSGLRSVRFSTYIFNEHSIAVNQRLGFELRHVFSCKVWTGGRDELMRAAPPDDDHVSVLRDEEEARRFVEESVWLGASGGLLCEGWRVYPYSWPLFRSRYLEPGRSLGVRAAGQLAGLGVFTRDPRAAANRVKAVLVEAADGQTIDVLLGALLRCAAEHARDDNEIEMILPPGTRIGSWAAARGFRSWEREGDFLVFEFPVALLARCAAAGCPEGEHRG